mmetsp:Transcript_7869/g.21253  ORF Transcript_7869/g.21253 Transcript_7869/m.21253 type:complete len:106 (+) Transcript_7869:10-327(+)
MRNQQSRSHQSPTIVLTQIFYCFFPSDLRKFPMMPFHPFLLLLLFVRGAARKLDDSSTIRAGIDIGLDGTTSVDRTAGFVDGAARNDVQSLLDLVFGETASDGFL